MSSADMKILLGSGAYPDVCTGLAHDKITGMSYFVGDGIGNGENPVYAGRLTIMSAKTDYLMFYSFKEPNIHSFLGNVIAQSNGDGGSNAYPG